MISWAENVTSPRCNISGIQSIIFGIQRNVNVFETPNEGKAVFLSA